MGGVRHRIVPGDTAALGGSVGSHDGEVQAGGAGIHRVEQGAALGTEEAAIGRMRGVAAQIEAAIGGFKNFDAATHAAIRARGFIDLRRHLNFVRFVYSDNYHIIICAMSGGGDIQRDKDVAIFDGDRVGADGAGAGLIAAAGNKIEAEGVERADHGITGKHAFGERATFVRATVIDGKYRAAACVEKAISRPPISNARPRPTGDLPRSRREQWWWRLAASQSLYTIPYLANITAEAYTPSSTGSSDGADAGKLAGISAPSPLRAAGSVTQGSCVASRYDCMRASRSAADALDILDQDRLEPFQADARHEIVGAFQIFCMLLIVLHKPGGDAQCLFLRLYTAEHIAFSHRDAARAADVNLPFAALGRDDSDILGRRLGTVSRAAGDGHFHLGGRLDPLEFFLDGDAQRGGIISAKTAPLRADAGFARAKRLGIGVARDHGEIFPDGGQVFFFDAEQVDALAAGEVLRWGHGIFWRQCRF